ncbi:MAG: hypothetical protein ACRD0V_14595 [Acidimicrobiales bacterium]
MPRIRPEATRQKLADMPNIGMIAPGYEASFVTLSDDIFEVDASSIIDLDVTGTWIEGIRVDPRD